MRTIVKKTMAMLMASVVLTGAFITPVRAGIIAIEASANLTQGDTAVVVVYGECIGYTAFYLDGYEYSTSSKQYLRYHGVESASLTQKTKVQKTFYASAESIFVKKHRDSTLTATVYAAGTQVLEKVVE